MSADLTQLTRDYVKVFDAKDLKSTMSMFAPNATLTDPENKCANPTEIEGLLTKIFGAGEVKFEAVNIFVDKEQATSVIEFKIHVAGKNLVGTDIINWTPDGKIKDLRAYLY